MPLEISLIPAEDRLDLSVGGRLDLSLTRDVAALLADLPRDLRTCIIDLTAVERVFESGLALLWLLGEHFQRQGIVVVVLSDQPSLLQRLSLVMEHASIVIPQDSPRAGALVEQGLHGRGPKQQAGVARPQRFGLAVPEGPRASPLGARVSREMSSRRSRLAPNERSEVQAKRAGPAAV